MERPVVVPPKPKEAPFVLRESRALLAIRLMSLLLIFSALFLLALLLSSVAGGTLQTSDIVVITIFLFFFLFVIVAVLFIFIILKWKSEYYQITPDGVISFSGILKKTEVRYACSFVEGMTVEQSIIGRFFDYGSVLIYDPSQQQKICLFNISAPHRNSIRIGNMMKKKGGDKSIPLMPSPEAPEAS